MNVDVVAETYHAIEREIAPLTCEWARRLREAGVEISAVSTFEYVRDVIYQEIQGELSTTQSDKFDERLRALSLPSDKNSGDQE